MLQSSTIFIQIQNITNVQETLVSALSELQATDESDDGYDFYKNQVIELKNRCDYMMLVLKVCSVIQ